MATADLHDDDRPCPGRDLLAEVASRGARLTRVGGEWVGPCPGLRRAGSVFDQHAQGAVQLPRLPSWRRCNQTGPASRRLRFRHCGYASRRCCARGNREQLGPASPSASLASGGFLRGGQHGSSARNLGRRTQSHGNGGELYLNQRGLQMAAELAGPVLRFHDALHFDGRRVPGLVALFRDVLTDEPTAIQRVFLQPNGERIGRRMLGRVRGAAIKLDGDAEVAEGLHIGEGLETCMAARALRLQADVGRRQRRRHPDLSRAARYRSPLHLA